MIKNFKKLEKLFLFFLLIIIALSSLINLLVNKDKILSHLSFDLISQDTKKNNYNEIQIKKKDHDIYVANKILEGGYILFFRHAEREKWIDITAYDALDFLIEDKNSIYYSKAVCLSDRGKIQARKIGFFFEYLNVPVQKIISSPSCRAVETANIAFGRIDQFNNLLLHYGPFNEDIVEFNNDVKKLILNETPRQNSNILFSAHNGVIFSSLFDGSFVKDQFFNETPSNEQFNLEEGGFYVFKIHDKKLLFVHKFNNFQHFIKIHLKRPK